MGCGVPTGWGTATRGWCASRRHRDRLRDRWHRHQRRAGCGYAGAKYVVIVVDPVEFKRETALKLGATHAFASLRRPPRRSHELTWGQGADQGAGDGRGGATRR